jgi:DNA replication and repair protein RecF
LHKKAVLKQKTIKVEELTPWTKILAEKAFRITSWRNKTLALIKPKIAEIYASFAPMQELLELKYHCEIEQVASRKLGELEESDFISVFLNSQTKELFQRRVLFGPHKDDLVFLLNDHKSRSFASQGQARSLVLASLLTSVELIEEQRGTSPVVLLDDVNSELDGERAEKFFDYLFSKKRQVLITGTEVSLGFLRNKADSVFEINSGIIN